MVLAIDLLLKVTILKDLAMGWLEELLAMEGQLQVEEALRRPIVARRSQNSSFLLYLLLMLMYLWRLLK